MLCRGTVWLTAPGGLWVYNPEGRLIGKVSIPEVAANLAWGGPGWRTLFVCACTSVHAVDVKIVRGTSLHADEATCDGFYGASSMERLPTERGGTEQTRNFKSLRLDRAT